MASASRYVVGSGDCKSPARQAGGSYLLEQPERFAGCVARRGGRDLDIPGVARQFGDSFEFAARRQSIISRVVSVRCVEQVDVATRWIETRLHELAHLGESGRG